MFTSGGTMSIGYPRNVVIVSVLDPKNELNHIAIAWHSYQSFKPPLYAISVSPARYSHDLILNAREFVVNFPNYSQAKLTVQVGRTSGRDINKGERFGIETEPSKVVSTPRIKGCNAYMECYLVNRFDSGDHTLFVGNIAHSEYQEGHLKEAKSFDVSKAEPLLYLANDTFGTTDPSKSVHPTRD